MTDARRRIAENRAAHDRLGIRYGERHPEVFNPIEQARLAESVARAVAGIETDTPPDQRTMLDVGSGTGNLSEKLLAHPGTVIASDLSQGMLDVLRDRLGSAGRLRTQQLNGTDLRPIDDGSVDLVGAYSVLHHVPDYLALVDEFARVLRPGGVILIEHEKAPSYWSKSEALSRFFAQAVIWPTKSWTRFVDPRSYWRRIRPFLIWQRWRDPRWMPEGDLHIWPDDHVEWDRVESRIEAAGCDIVVRQDHLAYEPRFDEAVWELARQEVADTRVLIARRRK